MVSLAHGICIGKMDGICLAKDEVKSKDSAESAKVVTDDSKKLVGNYRSY